MAWRPQAVAFAALLAALGPSLADGLPPFSDYEVILARKPFGDLAKAGRRPDAAEAEAEAQAVQQKKDQQALARQIDLVAINITPRRSVAVGFVDKSTKPSRSLYLDVGGTEFGYTVVSADVSKETAVIEKDGTSVTLKLGKGLVDDAGEADANAPQPGGAAQSGSASTAAEAPAGGTAGGATPRPIAGMPPRGIRPAGLTAAGAHSYREQSRMRHLAAIRADAEEKAKMREELRAIAESTSKEAAAKREREMNLELLSRGQQPLSPIELTPEEDAELVRKGVLPSDSEPK